MVVSPYKQAGVNLYKNGLSIIPISYKNKIPTVKEWSKFCNEKADKALLNKWYKEDMLNIGVTLGESSGIIALDFDYDVDNLHAKIIDIMGDVVIAKKAEKGFTAFFRYNGEVSKSWSRGGETILDLLSTGRQTVVPPSVHPSGIPYTYTTEKTLENTPISELQYLPSDFSERVDAIVNPAAKTKTTSGEGIDLEILKNACQKINDNDDLDYDAWLNIGMALKLNSESVGEEQEHYQLWLEISLRSAKFDDKLMPQKWESFKREGVTLGTLVHYIRESGYKGSLRPVVKPESNELLREIQGWRKKGRPEGVTSGVKPLDRLLKWRKGQLTVFTGYPGAGKSEFTDHIIYNLCINRGFKALLVSFEGAGQATHLESYLHRHTGKIFDTRTEQEDLTAFNNLKDKIDFYDTANNSDNIDHILQYAEGLDIDLLLLDPFDYLSSEMSHNPYQHVKYCLKAMKQFCKKTNKIVFLVAHPRTQRVQSGDSLGRCNLWDIAGGFDFWKKTDNGIVVHKDFEDYTQVEVQVQKVKIQDTDSLGSVQFRFNKYERNYEEVNNIDI